MARKLSSKEHTLFNTETTMKKTYIAPTATEVILTSEASLLTGSIKADIDGTGDGEDDVYFESNQRGWSSESWSNQED